MTVIYEYEYILMIDSSPFEVRIAQRVFTEKVFGRVSDHAGIYLNLDKPGLFQFDFDMGDLSLVVRYVPQVSLSGQ